MMQDDSPPSVAAFLRRALAYLYTVQSALATAIVLFSALLIVIQVFLRYVLEAPLMGIEELLLFPTIWMYMLGGANASYERTHIECGILSLYMKRPLTIKFFYLFRSLISSAICAWLLYWAYWYFEYALRVNKISALLHIPLVIAQSALFLGLLLMLLYTIAELIERIAAFAKSDTAAREESTC